MIITISGKAGSGKSTVAKLVAKKLKMKHFSTGDFMREIAKEKGITLLKLSKFAEKDEEVDKLLDKRQTEFGKKEDNFVIDSRLGFHFIPKSIKIFLKASLDVRAQRILKDKRGYNDVEKLKQEIIERENSENKRYSDYYQILDYSDSIYYHLVVDTDNLDINDVVDEILNFVESGRKLYK